MERIDFTKKCDCYNNHHEIFHIVQAGLTEEIIAEKLSHIFKKNDFVADGKVYKNGANFSTAKEDIRELTLALSLLFPEATCFGQDTWDNEGYIVCYRNGKESQQYRAKFTYLTKVDDEIQAEFDLEKEYYEVELLISVPVEGNEPYVFDVGGGCVYIDSVKDLNRFRKKAALSSN